MTDKLNFVFLQLPAAKEPTADSSFVEKWAYYVREMGSVSEKPEGLDGYFSQLFDAANRRNIEERKLSIYDDMVRDDIQIEAEKQYALDELREELRFRGAEEKQAALDELREELRFRGAEEKQAALDELREELTAEKQEAVEEAKAQGIEQGKLDTARNMKTLGIAAEVISHCTGLTLEQIAEL